MGKLDTTDKVTWKDWQDGQVMTAEDHMRERDTIIEAINDNYDQSNSQSQFLLITQIMGVF